MLLRQSVHRNSKLYVSCLQDEYAAMKADNAADGAAAASGGVASYFVKSDRDPWRDRLLRGFVMNCLPLSLLEDPDLRYCWGKK